MGSQTREVQGFNKIELLGAGEIHYKQGDSWSLQIEAEDGILDFLSSEIKGDSLVLAIEKGRSINTRESIHYHITSPKLEVLRIAGGGRFDAESIDSTSLLLDVPGAADIEIGAIEVNAFRMDVKGAVKMRLRKLAAQGISFDVKGTLEFRVNHLKAEAITSTIEGTCNLDLAGEARAQIIHAPGVINYQAGQLESSQTTVNTKGMSNLTLWVQDNLTVRMEGFGNLRYYGSPSRSVKINGMGNIQRIADKPKTTSYV